MRRERFRAKAVTLLEVTLAVSIMVPVLATVFIFYANSLESADQAQVRVRNVQLARVILDRITQEIRQSTGFTAGFGTGIFGTEHQVSINTVVIPDKALVERRGARARKRPGQFDLRQVDYYIAWDDVNTDENGDPRALGLVRRERRTFNKLKPAAADQDQPGTADQDQPGTPDQDQPGIQNQGRLGAGAGIRKQPDNPLAPGTNDNGAADGPPDGVGQASDSPFDDSLDKELSKDELEGAKRELYAPEIKYIQFRYHDGHRWWKSWEIKTGNALPQMVMVTIGYKSELPDDNQIKIIDDAPQSEDDIKPLPEDRFMRVVRIPQADSFFGSRVQREVSSFSSLKDAQ